MTSALPAELSGLAALVSSPLAWALALVVVALVALVVTLVRQGDGTAPRARRAPTAYVAALHAWLAGRREEAERALRRVLEADPHHVDAALLLARLERRRGRLDRALAVDRELLTRHHLSRRQRCDALAALLADTMALGYAAVHLEPLADAVLELEPAHPLALDVAVTASRERGAFGRAIERVERAERHRQLVRGAAGSDVAEAVTSQTALFLCREGEALCRRGDLDAARRFFRRSLRHDESHPAPYLGLAALATAHQRPGEALRWYRRAAELGPPELVVDGLEALGEPRAEALLESLLDEALSETPHRPFLRRARIRQLRRAGDEARALAEVRRGVELGERSPAMLRAGAEILRRRGSAAEALDFVLDALPADPMDWHCRHCGEATTRHAWQCRRCGRWDTVVEQSATSRPAASVGRVS